MFRSVVLAGARAAAYQNVPPVEHARPQKSLPLPWVMPVHPPRDRPFAIAAWETFGLSASAPCRQAAGMIALTREPVGQPEQSYQRLALVDPSAHLGHDPLDDRLRGLCREMNRRPDFSITPPPFDINQIAGHDHDFPSPLARAIGPATAQSRRSCPSSPFSASAE